MPILKNRKACRGEMEKTTDDMTNRVENSDTIAG